MTDRMRGALNDALVVVLKSLSEKEPVTLNKTQIGALEKGFEDFLGKLSPSLAEEPRATEEPRKGR